MWGEAQDLSFLGGGSGDFICLYVCTPEDSIRIHGLQLKTV